MTDIEKIYSARRKSADSSYLQITVCVCAVCATGIGIAVLKNVLLGAALALFAAAVYSFFSADDLYKQLGLRFERICGSLRITRAVARYGDALVIPSRLTWADVTEIGDGAFDSKLNDPLSRIYIPKSIKTIGKGVLGDTQTHVCIYYEGTQSDWQAISGSESILCEVRFECAQPSPRSKNKLKADATEKEAGR